MAATMHKALRLVSEFVLDVFAKLHVVSRAQAVAEALKAPRE